MSDNHSEGWYPGKFIDELLGKENKKSNYTFQQAAVTTKEIGTNLTQEMKQEIEEMIDKYSRKLADRVGVSSKDINHELVEKWIRGWINAVIGNEKTREAAIEYARQYIEQLVKEGKLSTTFLPFLYHQGNFIYTTPYGSFITSRSRLFSNVR